VVFYEGSGPKIICPIIAFGSNQWQNESVAVRRYKSELCKLFTFIIIVMLCALRHEVFKHSLSWALQTLFWLCGMRIQCFLGGEAWLWRASEERAGSHAFKASFLKLPTLPLIFIFTVINQFCYINISVPTKCDWIPVRMWRWLCMDIQQLQDIWGLWWHQSGLMWMYQWYSEWWRDVCAGER